MSWLKTALTDRARKSNNILRLQDLYLYLKELKDMSSSCQSCAFDSISKLQDLPLIKGRPRLYDKIQEAYIGNFRQKVVLDAPKRFSAILSEAMKIITFEIKKEKHDIDEKQKNRELNKEK